MKEMGRDFGLRATNHFQYAMEMNWIVFANKWAIRELVTYS
jgi:hypothetical protein